MLVRSCRLWCVSGGFSLHWQIAWLLQIGGTLLGVAKHKWWSRQECTVVPSNQWPLLHALLCA